MAAQLGYQVQRIKYLLVIPIAVKAQYSVAVEVEVDEGELGLQHSPSAPEEVRSKRELTDHTLVKKKVEVRGQ